MYRIDIRTGKISYTTTIDKYNSFYGDPLFKMDFIKYTWTYSIELYSTEIIILYLYVDIEKTIDIPVEDIEVETEGKYPSLSKIINPSEHRVYNGCPHQKECGGCQFMHMDYQYELEQKKKYMNELFKGIKGIPEIDVISTFEPYNYRNKSQMTYKLSKNRKVVCGFYEEHSHRLVTVNECMLQAKPANKVIKELNNKKKNKIKKFYVSNKVDKLSKTEWDKTYINELIKRANDSWFNDEYLIHLFEVTNYVNNQNTGE